MNIRARSLTGIVPMFAILGIATGILVSSFQYREMFWGLSEEASSLAIAIAEFIGPQDLKILSADSPATNEKDLLIKNITRAIDATKVQRITIRNGSDDSTLLDLGPATRQTLTFPNDLDPDKVTVNYHPANPDNPAVMQAFVAVKDQHDQLSPYILATQISSTPLTKHVEQVLHQVLIYLLTAVAIGTICALIISSILIGYIRDLAQAAERAANGDYNIQQERSCSIMEINDLWNTFQTATSVLRGVVSNSRRQLLDMELARTENDLIHAFMRSDQSEGILKYGSLEWAVSAVRNDQPETIAYLFVINSTLYAVTGTVALSETGLKTAIAVSALLDYLKRHLSPDTLPTVLNAVLELFSIVSMRLIAYNPTDQAIVIHEYQQETGSFKENRLVQSKQPMLFHDLSSPLGVRLDLFMNAFGNSPCKELLDNLLTIIRDQKHDCHGALIVIAPVN